MIGFLIYLATDYHIPHMLYLVPFIILFILNYKRIDFNLRNININYFIIFIIVGLSFINILFLKNIRAIDFVPYTVLMIPGFFIAKFIKKIDLKIIVLFILFESLVSIIEYVLGISTIFYKSDFYVKYKVYKFFYFTRTYGLSSNSSIFALKLLLAILLIDYFDLFKKYKTLIMIVLFFGILFSFSRTVIIVLVFYYVMQLIAFFIKTISNPHQKFKFSKYFYFTSAMIFVIFIFISISINISKNPFYNQITRGKNHIELSGREEIWPQFIDEIKSNLIFGNHSKKFLANYRGGKIHAHNSFLQTLANNGIIIFVFFILLLLININKNNILYILTLTLYSMTQYGYFWGISLTDIILFLFFIYNNQTVKAELK